MSVLHSPVPQPGAGDGSSSAHDEARTLSLEFELAHPPAKVWRALTEPGLLTQWLLPVIGHSLEPGASFIFQAPAQPGWDGVVSCKMREIDPMRRISWSWVVGDIDTVVTFTLTPMDAVQGGGAGTRLSIVQSGFKPDQKQAFGGARYGWKMMGGRLADLLGRFE